MNQTIRKPIKTYIIDIMPIIVSDHQQMPTIVEPGRQLEVQGIDLEIRSGIRGDYLHVVDQYRASVFSILTDSLRYCSIKIKKKRKNQTKVFQIGPE